MTQDGQVHAQCEPLAAPGSRRQSSSSRRRSVRRAVSLECSLECDCWEGSISLPATDLCEEGVWLETPYTLQRGDELVISFHLPDAPHEPPLWAIAEVARVGHWRRRRDVHASGMGLFFTYCDEADRARLSAALRGRPPPLPLGRPAGEPLRAVEAQVDEGACELPPVLDDELALV